METARKVTAALRECFRGASRRLAVTFAKESGSTSESFPFADRRITEANGAIFHAMNPRLPAALLPPARISSTSTVTRWLRICTGLALLPHTGLATEGGTTAFPNGGEDFLVAAMPPPGVYGWITYNQYSAGRVTDADGQMPVHDFSLRVHALVPRLDWVKPVSILGADRWGTLLVMPVLDLDLKLSPVPGVSVQGAKRGAGDLTMGNGLHWTFANFEMVNAIDVAAPTGAYNSGNLVNPGQNRWVIRLNHMGTWRPTPTWDVSYRLHWDYNFRNSATDYRSGQTVYLNWAVGWKPSPPLTIGVAGYSLRQITDDRQGGQVVGPDGNRVSVDGLGPCVKYFLPNHVMLTAKYFQEFRARNHPKGRQFWFQVTVPF
jgi:hypothetical protein